jgi:small conductance mechanosensitive channel
MDWMFLLAQDAPAEEPPAENAAEQAAEEVVDIADVETWKEWLDPQTLGDRALEFGEALLAAVLIFIIGKWVAKLLTNLLRKMLRRGKVEETLVGFFANILHALLLVFVVLAALKKLGVDTTSASAIIAAAGLAIGFALQGSLSNFAAGVMMIFFKPVQVGDLVSAAGTFGVVREVALFATIIDTPDGKKVIVPNSGVTGGNIENWTANGKIRVDMTFGIGYGSDIDTSKAIMMEIIESDPRVLKDPAPTVAMVAHADSSVNFVCRPWVEPAHYWDVWFDTHEAVKKAFDAKGIEIPFPQRDVHMHGAA